MNSICETDTDVRCIDNDGGVLKLKDVSIHDSQLGIILGFNAEIVISN